VSGDNVPEIAMVGEATVGSQSPQSPAVIPEIGILFASQADDGTRTPQRRARKSRRLFEKEGDEELRDESECPSPSKSMSSYTSTAVDIEKVNRKIGPLLTSPFKKTHAHKANLAASKYIQLKETAGKLISSVSKGFSGTPKKECVYCERLLRDLAAKFTDLKLKREKYMCLTSVPKRYGPAEIKRQFACTSYEAENARVLRAGKGHFSYPIMNYKRRFLSDELVEEVKAFYLEHGNSRVSPSVRDTILIKNIETGRREPVAKQFILVSLDELYAEFKAEFVQYPIGRTKFSKLRPQQCKWPGQRGQHRVCVCQIHENYRLMSEVLLVPLSAEDLAKKLLCNNPNDDCFMGFCDLCPKQEQVETLFDDLEEEVEFNQWKATDATTLETLKESKEDFRNRFTAYIPKILEHHRINIRQKAYIDALKKQTILDRKSVCVTVDFGQNYSFIVQDAVQGVHWNNQQCTVHPFVVNFFKNGSEVLDYKTYFAISDILDHDANSFHILRERFIEMLKADCVQWGIGLEKIYYVSDGAASQYKNFKNFVNLHLHKRKFGVDAEWHFTATSHGKSSCDAMVAVAKRSTRLESLKPGRNILRAEEMFNFCRQKLTSEKLEFYFVSKEGFADKVADLNKNYRNAKTVPGTRSYHSIIPDRTGDSETLLQLRLLSSSAEFVTHNIGHVESLPPVCEPERFVAAKINNDWQVGVVQLVDHDINEAEINFMKRVGRGNRLKWPPVDLIHILPFANILCNVSRPLTDDGDIYSLREEDITLV
jgi:hypothetical protein